MKFKAVILGCLLFPFLVKAQEYQTLPNHYYPIVEDNPERTFYLIDEEKDSAVVHLEEGHYTLVDFNSYGGQHLIISVDGEGNVDGLYQVFVKETDSRADQYIEHSIVKRTKIYEKGEFDSELFFDFKDSIYFVKKVNNEGQLILDVKQYFTKKNKEDLLLKAYNAEGILTEERDDLQGFEKEYDDEGVISKSKTWNPHQPDQYTQIDYINGKKFREKKRGFGADDYLAHFDEEGIISSKGFEKEGKVIQEIYQDGKLWQRTAEEQLKDGRAIVTTEIYIPEGNLDYKSIEKKELNGNSVLEKYDASGKLVKRKVTEESDSAIIERTYDASGKLIDEEKTELVIDAMEDVEETDTGE